jgi:hypothetical protein
MPKTKKKKKENDNDILLEKSNNDHVNHSTSPTKLSSSPSHPFIVGTL